MIILVYAMTYKSFKTVDRLILVSCILGGESLGILIIIHNIYFANLPKHYTVTKFGVSRCILVQLS